MTRAARQIVASINSSVDDRSQFADDCPVREVPDAVVLGCFGGGRLRVLRVDRPDLAPVMIVSMTHEMLHGAYEQLDRKERNAIDAELDRVYESLADRQLTKLVDSYAKTEPGHRHTELHSLLATQVTTLSPRLERYYRRWFHDRQQIVAAFQSYNGVLTALEQRHDELRAQLNSIDAQLTDLNSRIDAAAQRSDDLGGQIDALRAQGRVGETDDLVGPQNAAAAEANALVAQDQELIDQYNAVVGEYNQLVESTNQIYDSISTRSEDSPTS
jgi:chromosome segregation ATPase